MKIKLSLLLVLPFVAFAGQNRYAAPVALAPAATCPAATCPADANRAECPLNTVSVAAPTTLSAAGLVFAIEEERLAHDLSGAASARWIAALGVTYQPQVLAAAEFATMIATSPGRGGR